MNTDADSTTVVMQYLMNHRGLYEAAAEVANDADNLTQLAAMYAGFFAEYHKDPYLSVELGELVDMHFDSVDWSVVAAYFGEGLS